MEGNMIQLKSSDDEIFTVEEDVAKHSGLIRQMIEDDMVDCAIPLSKITSKTLIKIIEFCKRHTPNHVPDDDYDKSSYEKQLKHFDKEFINVDVDALYDLLMASNFLDLKSLLDLVCQQAADIIKGKTPEQIREIFNIINDFTPEEEAQLRKENSWAFK